MTSFGKYKDDPNYEIWFKDFTSHKESYSCVFEGYDETFVAFWHSDENRPFLIVAVDVLVINENGSIDVFSRDYEEAIVTIWEWDYWKLME
jgi:hypothetical protein